MSVLELGQRNATLADLAGLLQRQHAAKLDVVVRGAAIRAVGGDLHVDGAGAPVLTEDGVTTGPAVLRPTASCDAGIAQKLNIPLAYLRRLRAEHLGLYDANVNGLLAADPARSTLIRAFRDDSGGTGVARAFLSNSYRMVDNLDVLMAALSGIRESGAATEIGRCDLTETRMYVQVRSADVAVHAEALLRGYTSPFTGERGADNPLVFAGFVVSNSETGNGSFSITPRLEVQVCRNGLAMTKDVLREIHLGGRLQEGVIRWSKATQDAALRLVTRQAADAVSTFLDRAYVERVVAGLEERAGRPVRDVTSTIEHVSKELRFTTEQQATILGHFISSGDRTAGGVLQAVTSTAQTLADADDAYAMERVGIRAMELAASFQR